MEAYHYSKKPALYSTESQAIYLPPMAVFIGTAVGLAIIWGLLLGGFYLRYNGDYQQMLD